MKDSLSVPNFILFFIRVDISSDYDYFTPPYFLLYLLLNILCEVTILILDQILAVVNDY